MVSRSLTDIYFLMRNNAIANKNIFHDNSVMILCNTTNTKTIANLICIFLNLIKYSDDRTALVIDLESGSAKTTSKVPPDWYRLPSKNF